MDLEYLQKLKKLETEFGSSQRKAFSIAIPDENPLYISLNIFSNYENIEFQDKHFEITRNGISKKKLGTALIEICSMFNEIEKVLYNYVKLCNNIKYENSTLIMETKIIKPFFLELGQKNIYFDILKDFEFKEYKKELNLFLKRKSDILDFKENIFNDMIFKTEDTEMKSVYQDIIETNNILKEFMESQTIKSFTIDYLKTYILELREIINLIEIYSNNQENSLYSHLNNNQKFFLFNILENPINDYMYPPSKIETKIKINDNYINVWNFKGQYLYRELTDNKHDNKKIILDYISNNNIELFFTYRITTLKELLIISLVETIKKNLTIRKCKNCNKYFIPENRTDEIYCNNICPQNPNKTCKEYGAKKTYRDNIKSRPLKDEHYKTSQFFRMRIKRNKDKNNIKEVDKLEKQFTKYKLDYEKKLKQYNNKKLTEEDFKNWIIQQKEL